MIILRKESYRDIMLRICDLEYEAQIRETEIYDCQKRIKKLEDMQKSVTKEKKVKK